MNGSIALYSMIMRKLSKRREIAEPCDKTVNDEGINGFDPDSPLQETSYVVLDTELTGLKLKKDSIVSLGAIKMKGGRIQIGDTFYRLVDPRTKLTGSSVVIHGITPSEAAECPDIDTLLPEFLDFCKGSILVGHFISIDMDFINAEMKRLFGHPLGNPALDTARIYCWMNQSDSDAYACAGGMSGDLALSVLARKYGIEVSDAHNALGDAFVTAQLFQRFLSLLPRYNIRTLGDLLGIGGRENRYHQKRRWSRGR